MVDRTFRVKWIWAGDVVRMIDGGPPTEWIPITDKRSRERTPEIWQYDLQKMTEN